MNPLAINFYVCDDGTDLPEFLRLAAQAGASAVGLTVRALENWNVRAIRQQLGSYGLRVSSLNSAGYFLYADPKKRSEQQALNERLLDAASELAAETLVLITGGLLQGTLPLPDARAAVRAGIQQLADEAARRNVFLGLEAIHPSSVLSKGCVNSLAQAARMVDDLDNAGLVVDLYHSWWDPDLLAAFDAPRDAVRLVQICNVRQSTAEVFERDVLSAGLLDVGAILRDMSTRGYKGYFEFEMFPIHLRGRAVAEVINEVGKEYRSLVSREDAGTTPDRHHGRLASHLGLPSKP